MQPLTSYSLFFLSVLVYTSLLAQPSSSKIDSLRNALDQFEEQDYDYGMTLLRLSNAIDSQAPEQSTTLAEEAVTVGKKIGDQKFTAQALNIQGACYLGEDRYAEAVQSFNDAISILLKDKNGILLGNCYNNIALTYKHLGDYVKSLEYHVRAEQEYDSVDFQIGMARTSNNLGSLYKLQGDLKQAEDAYQKALHLHKQLDNPSGIGTTQLNLGLLYTIAQDYTEAESFLDSALAYCRRHNALTTKVGTLMGLGDLYLKRAENRSDSELSQANLYARAEQYLLPALAGAKKLSMPDSEANVLMKLARLEANRGNFNLSQQFAHQVKLLSDSIDTPASQANAEEILSYVYEKAGRWQLALNHYQQYKTWQDSIFNEKTASLYQSQQVQLEVGRKDRELASQATQLVSLNERIALENRWKWTLGGASLLLLLAGVLYYQKFRTRKVYAERLEVRNALITKQKEEIEATKLQLEATDDTINYFASSLYGKNTVDEILWDVAKNCISRLGLEDCVIYLLDEEHQVLIQKAAYGPKNPKDFTIYDPIEIPVGQGIVGTVAQTGEAEVIHDTSQDERYITDDDTRLSELAVPIKHQGKVIGVIDSEHSDKNFYTDYHQKALKTITAICASKIAQAQADEKTRKAEEARLEAEQIKAMDVVKSRFFANISHEFRTPLHLILGPLRTHQDEQIPDHELGMMQRNAQRLLRLVNQLMDLSKLEVDQLQLDYQSADVFEFLRAIADSFIPLTEEKSLTYQIDIPLRSYPVQFDPDKLEKIVYNLLSNAIKFTPHQGKVSMHASVEADGRLRVSVSDTGLGIPEDLQDKIFDRFYQVDGSNTRAFEGTGIGLALIKELVELHGGTIALNSVELQGTTFVVVLPLPAANGELVEPLPLPKEVSTEVIDNKEYTKQTIRTLDDTLPQLLLVEDTPDLRRYICDHLGGHFQIREAIHGKEGLELAMEQVPDIIITDVMMPEMDGVELTSRLKDDLRTSHIPILMLTARDDTETKRAGFQTGADQYLTKPFDKEELIDRLQSLLKQRDRLREKYSREVTLRPQDITVNDHDATFLERCLRLVEENLSNPEFSVEQLQREIGMSRMQLHRKLKALTNQSATEFIRGIRLQKAAQMLEQNDVQVAEVAYDVGFNHLSYFAKCFKEKFGVAPSEYTKSGSETA